MLHGERILFIDDEPQVRRALLRSARQHGFDAEAAEGAGQALRMAREGRYAVIVTDTGGVLAGYTPTSGPQSPGGNILSGIAMPAAGGENAIRDADFGYRNPNLNTIRDMVLLAVDAPTRLVADGVQPRRDMSEGGHERPVGRPDTDVVAER